MNNADLATFHHTKCCCNHSQTLYDEVVIPQYSEELTRVMKQRSPLFSAVCNISNTSLALFDVEISHEDSKHCVKFCVPNDLITSYTAA